MKKLLIGILFAGLALASTAQGYSDHRQITQRIQKLATQYPEKVRVRSLGRTENNRDIWVLTVGKGETESHPAIAILGGVDGRHLLGVELATGIAERLLTLPGGDSLLSANTYYIFPDVNPDATAQYFAPLRYERVSNGRPTDNDRDGYPDEDPYEDLNGDGLITHIRIISARGTHIESPVDPRMLIPADPARGEIGTYLLLSEGVDNDGDGQWNEDGDGGVHFNRNFTFGYQNFLPETGENAVSETETRTVADFLYDAFNVHTVLTFGPDNNCSQASKAFMTDPDNPDRENSRDSRINAYISTLYNKFVPGLADAVPTEPEGGEFYTWAYQHYGRYSYTTPGWQPSGADPSAPGTVSFPDRAQQNGAADIFVPWTRIDHPDFPGEIVEVGGFKPHALHNPPFEAVPELVNEHTAFLQLLTRAAPQLTLASITKEPVEKGVARVTLTIWNSGLMPTINQVGEKSYFLKHLSVRLTPSQGMTLLQGNRLVTLPVLQGGETAEFSWLIHGNGRLGVEAGCPTAGTVVSEISL